MRANEGATRLRLVEAPPKLSVMLDGVAGSTDREERGIKGVRGEAAVTMLRAEIARFRKLKAQ